MTSYYLMKPILENVEYCCRLCNVCISYLYMLKIGTFRCLHVNSGPSIFHFLAMIFQPFGFPLPRKQIESLRWTITTSLVGYVHFSKLAWNIPKNVWSINPPVPKEYNSLPDNKSGANTTIQQSNGAKIQNTVDSLFNAEFWHFPPISY